jgi:hypothetical protein
MLIKEESIMKIIKPLIILFLFSVINISYASTSKPAVDSNHDYTAPH